MGPWYGCTFIQLLSHRQWDCNGLLRNWKHRRHDCNEAPNLESKSDACNMAREYGATSTHCSRTDKRIRLRSRSIMPARSQEGNDSYNTVVGREESGWCSDVTSTHGAWRHARVRFLLPGVSFVSSVRTQTTEEEEGLRDGHYSQIEEYRCSEEVAHSQSLHF
jgi:hypothetical protein